MPVNRLQEVLATELAALEKKGTRKGAEDVITESNSAAAGGVTSLGWYGAYKRPADTAGDEDEALLRGGAPALVERRPWSQSLLLEALRDPPQQ